MHWSLVLTALGMGLAGGPHCLAMCGAACAGIGQAAAPRRGRALALFQFGRLSGYALLGATVAGSMEGLDWLTVHSAAFRPIWTMLHVAAAVIGLVLSMNARQPLWLETGARRVWRQVRATTHAWGMAAPIGLGLAWALLPCGLLYSALLVAALAGGVLRGAVVMALFAAGSAVSLLLGPWLLLRLKGDARLGTWGIRIAGLALLISSLWALWMGLAHDQAPWCAPVSHAR